MKSALLLAPFLLALAPRVLALDDNGNGFSDVTERNRNMVSMPPWEDWDGDGEPNLSEDQAGTDPLNSASRFLLSVGRVPTTGETTLQWAGVKGRRYRVQFSADLLDWRNFAGYYDGLGAAIGLNLGLPQDASEFYRLAMLASPDSDGDGLDDAEEALLGSDPLKPDTDGDGLADTAEFRLRTSPLLPDTDGDGLADGVEVALHNDPIDSSDGLPQGGENHSMKIRFIYRGTWPNYTVRPALPSLGLTITQVASVTESDANTSTATPGGTYINSTATADKMLNRGYKFNLALNFSGSSVTWPTVEGRFQAAPTQPATEPINFIISSFGTASGATPKGWYFSNPAGGVWPEATWVATGFPSLTSPPNQPLEARNYNQATLYAVDFDLDIDSDNTKGAPYLPERSNAEDDVEETQAKIIPVNSNDDDYDDEGLAPDSRDLEVPGERDLVPLILEVAPSELPWNRVKVKFLYPGDATYSAVSSGSLRLWNKAGPGAARTAADYIEPNREYTAAELGLDKSTRLKLLVEGVNATASTVDIEAVFLFQGDVTTREYFRDKVKAQVSGVVFDRLQNFNGYDEQSSPNWQMVPLGETRQVSLTVSPATLAPQITVASTDTAKFTVQPAVPPTASSTLTLTGVAAGDTARVEARAGTPSVALAKLGVSVMARKEVKLALHAITQPPYAPAQPCVERGDGPAGINNVLFTSTLGGDDQFVDDPANPGVHLAVRVGANGICETAAAPGDKQKIPVGPLAPAYVPTKAALEDYLNAIYVPQANTHFTVVEPDYFTINYDLNKDGRLDFSDSAITKEQEIIDSIAKNNSAAVNFNMYFVANFSYPRYPLDNQPFGLSVQSLSRSHIRNHYASMSSLIIHNTCSHEIGHLFGLGHSNEPPSVTPGVGYMPGLSEYAYRKRLMYGGQLGNDQRLLIKREWDSINPQPR